MTLNHVILVRIQARQKLDFAMRSIRKINYPERAKRRGTIGIIKSFMYYVYLIECRDGTIYTGITTDVKRRFKEHSSGRGGAYTKVKKVKKLLYAEECKNRSVALKRESEIKGWRREKKLNLINNS